MFFRNIYNCHVNSGKGLKILKGKHKNKSVYDHIDLPHIFNKKLNRESSAHVFFRASLLLSFLPLHHEYDWLLWEGMAFILQGDEYLEGNCKTGL